MTETIRDLILDHAFALLLVMARTGTMFAIVPGLGESSIPAQVKAGVILALTLVLLPGIEPLLPPRPESELSLAGMILAEMANGLWFGWLARMLTLSLPMAGQFIADVTGQSNILISSPDLGAQTAAVSRLYEMAVPVLILSTGLYRLIVTALIGFYHLVPPGTLPRAADGAWAAAGAVSMGFELALRLAAPFILAGVAWNVAIGLMARMVPRLQIFFIAAPGQIGMGLLLLTVLAVPLLAVWMDAMRASLGALPGGF